MAEKERSGDVFLDIKGEMETNNNRSIVFEIMGNNSITDSKDDQVSKNNNNAKEEQGLKWRKNCMPKIGILAKTTRLFNKPKNTSTPLAEAPEVDEDDLEEIPKNNDSKDKKKRKQSLWFYFQWIVFVVLTTLMVVSLTLGVLKRESIWGMKLWKWCVMFMVVFCGRLVSGWFITLLIFIMERNFILKEKLLYFVHGVKNGVRHCLWITLVMASWFPLFDPKVKRNSKTHKAFDYMTRILIAAQVASIIWLVKIVLLKILATNFHTNQFFERIRESYYNQYIMQCLAHPLGIHNSDSEHQSNTNGINCFGVPPCGRKVIKNINKPTATELSFDQIQKMKANSVSGWNMAQLMKQVSGAQHITLSDAIDDCTEAEISNEEKARRVAIRIFNNVAKPGEKFIFKDDLKRFLKEEDVEKIFPKFAGAVDSKKIKRTSLKKWVVNVYLDRHILASSLNDAESVVKELNKIVSVVVILIILVISAMIVGLATTRGILLITSQLVIVAFIFGNSCKTVFEAIIFVFVMHPFDVGDRCVIDGIQMTVQSISILTTTFLRYDQERISYPNSVLATKPISNFMRSPQMGDNIKFNISASTPIKKIDELKSEIKSYIMGKPHLWAPKHTIAVQEIENMNNMKMVLFFMHTINYQDFMEKTNRRTSMVLELKKLLEKLEITYHLLPADVNVNIIQQTTSHE